MKPKIARIILCLILLTGFLVRLYKIKNPVADWHSWRQADTSAVTRNYVKYGINLFYPRYDDFTDVSGKGLFNPHGYRFVEFPIFNLIHFSFYKIAPFLTLEIWGRLTAVFSSLVSALILYFLVRRHTSQTAALLSAAFYLFLPYNIYFTRVILPDPLMVTFYLASLNLFDLWITSHRRNFLYLSLLFGAMAMLTKPVAVFFLLPMLWQIVKKYGFKVFKTWQFYVGVILITFPFGLWRLWSMRHPEGVPASAWLLNGNNIRFKGAFFQWIFGERIGTLILGKWGLFPALTGVLVATPYFVVWILSALLYLFTFATGNVQHDYYQLPIIPIIAVLLSLGTIELFKHNMLRKFICVICVLMGIAFAWYDIRGDYQVNNWSIVHAGQAVDKLTPKDAIVVAPYMGDTAFLYQTNRPGFPFMYMPIKDMKDRYNASYYVSVNFDADTNAIMNKYTVVAKTSEYVIVKLVEPIHP
jgi:hypothetical protein